MVSLTAESAFDASGRPLESAFYTGFPAYHNLIHEIYQQSQLLDSGSRAGKEGEEGVGSEPPKFWVKRKTMANIIQEEISEEQVKQSGIGGRGQ